MADSMLMRDMLIAIGYFRLRRSDTALSHLERTTKEVQTTFPDARESLESIGSLSLELMSGHLTRTKLIEVTESGAFQTWGGRVVTGLFDTLIDHLWVLDRNTLIAHLPSHEVDLSAHPQLWRVLCALAEGALMEDGTAQGLPSIEIFERAWPGERVSAESADDRVRSSIYKLRKLGLDPGLRSERHGYFLDPAIVVAWRNK